MFQCLVPNAELRSVTTTHFLQEELQRDALAIIKRAIPKQKSDGSHGNSTGFETSGQSSCACAVKLVPKGRLKAVQAEGRFVREVSLHWAASQACQEDAVSAQASAQGLIHGTYGLAMIRTVCETMSEVQVVQDMVLGGSLLQSLSTVAFTESDVACVATRILSALGVMHDAGIVLRCLVPDRFQILEGQASPCQLVVMSGVFGGAIDVPADLGEDQNALSHAPSLPPLHLDEGVQLFAAPDCNDPASLREGRPDIWSVGILLSLLLAGEPPRFLDATPQADGSTAPAIGFGPRWALVSAEARDAVSQMLRPAGLRPSARRLLRHRWLGQFQMTGFVGSGNPLVDARTCVSVFARGEGQGFGSEAATTANSYTAASGDQQIVRPRTRRAKLAPSNRSVAEELQSPTSILNSNDKADRDSSDLNVAALPPRSATSCPATQKKEVLVKPTSSKLAVPKRTTKQLSVSAKRSEISLQRNTTPSATLESESPPQQPISCDSSNVNGRASAAALVMKRPAMEPPSAAVNVEDRLDAKRQKGAGGSSARELRDLIANAGTFLKSRRRHGSSNMLD